MALKGSLSILIMDQKLPQQKIAHKLEYSNQSVEKKCTQAVQNQF